MRRAKLWDELLDELTAGCLLWILRGAEFAFRN